MISAYQTISQHVNLGNIRRNHGQTGGEILAHLERIRGERQLINRKRIERDVERFAIRRQLGVRLATEKMYVSNTIEYLNFLFRVNRDFSRRAF